MIFAQHTPSKSSETRCNGWFVLRPVDGACNRPTSLGSPDSEQPVLPDTPYGTLTRQLDLPPYVSHCKKKTVRALLKALGGGYFHGEYDAIVHDGNSTAPTTILRLAIHNVNPDFEETHQGLVVMFAFEGLEKIEDGNSRRASRTLIHQESEWFRSGVKHQEKLAFSNRVLHYFLRYFATCIPYQVVADACIPVTQQYIYARDFSQTLDVWIAAGDTAIRTLRSGDEIGMTFVYAGWTLPRMGVNSTAIAILDQAAEMFSTPGHPQRLAALQKAGLLHMSLHDMPSAEEKVVLAWNQYCMAAGRQLWFDSVVVRCLSMTLLYIYERVAKDGGPESRDHELYILLYKLFCNAGLDRSIWGHEVQPFGEDALLPVLHSPNKARDLLLLATAKPDASHFRETILKCKRTFPVVNLADEKLPEGPRTKKVNAIMEKCLYEGDPGRVGAACCRCKKFEPQGGPKLMKCPCQAAYYCNKECQLAHWKEHKKECAHYRQRLEGQE